jgi:peptidoglycan/xylan/chitin deacetylase (PgdA/CDA1 family)
MLLLLVLAGFLPFTGTAPQLNYGPEPESANYASGIPVLAYHQVSSNHSKYSVTPFKLRDDLQRLYDAGFFLILPEDIENGLSGIPFDRRPLMITFDDGWENNFRYIELADGTLEIDPNCALAIVNSFIEENPDFGKGVVFFISWDKTPFGSLTEEKLNTLLDMGHSIGNHTEDHRSFTQIPPLRFGEQVIPALDSFHRVLGLRVSEINTLSYPGGRLPSGVNAENTLREMEYRNRPAVVQGYLVDGAVSSFKRIFESENYAEYRISRIDMALYSVPMLLGLRNIMIDGRYRDSLHDDIPWRP